MKLQNNTVCKKILGFISMVALASISCQNRTSNVILDRWVAPKIAIQKSDKLIEVKNEIFQDFRDTDEIVFIDDPPQTLVSLVQMTTEAYCEGGSYGTFEHKTHFNNPHRIRIREMLPDFAYYQEVPLRFCRFKLVLINRNGSTKSRSIETEQIALSRAPELNLKRAGEYLNLSTDLSKKEPWRLHQINASEFRTIVVNRNEYEKGTVRLLCQHFYSNEVQRKGGESDLGTIEFVDIPAEFQDPDQRQLFTVQTCRLAYRNQERQLFLSGYFRTKFPLVRLEVKSEVLAKGKIAELSRQPLFRISIHNPNSVPAALKVQHNVFLYAYLFSSNSQTKKIEGKLDLKITGFQFLHEEYDRFHLDIPPSGTLIIDFSLGGFFSVPMNDDPSLKNCPNDQWLFVLEPFEMFQGNEPFKNRDDTDQFRRFFWVPFYDLKNPCTRSPYEKSEIEGWSL